MIFSLLAAALFGSATYFIYGAEGLSNFSWIIWFIVLMGSTITLLDEMNSCLPCRLKAHFAHLKLLDRLCAETPCGKF